MAKRTNSFYIKPAPPITGTKQLGLKPNQRLEVERLS